MDKKKVLLVLFRFCLSRNYRYIRKLRVFDAGYYLDISRQLHPHDIDPLWNYLKITGDSPENHLPHPLQWRQLADPHPLFDTAFYLIRYFPEGLSVNPFVHYLRLGWKKGFMPGPFLEPETYRQTAGWQEKDGNPLVHYTRFGAARGVKPSQFFDVEWYLDKNPVLAGVKSEIIKHYKLHGAGLGKSPAPVFDAGFYLQQLKDPQPAARDPISHYAALADNSELKPSPWFDPDFYRYTDREKIPRSKGLSHYLACGVFQGAYPDERVARLPYKPLISILVPVYNPNLRFLKNCISSVLYQAYPHWQLCLVDDGSSDGQVREVLESMAGLDERIKISFLDENAGISAATNAAASLADGDFLGFLDNDDELTPDCLYRVAETIQRTGAAVIYTDEDLIGDDGSRLSIFRKPGFNYQLLLSHNYITHFVAVSRPLFEQLGGFESRYDGAQDFDLMLRLADSKEKICHIAEILYHWRAVETSTSVNHSQKDYAHEAGRLAVRRVLQEGSIQAEVADTDLKYHYRIRYGVSASRPTAVLIWLAQFDEDEVRRIGLMLEETLHDNVHLILVCGGEEQQNDSNSLDQQHCTLFRAPGLGRSQALHQAAMQAQEEYLVFLDAAATAVAPGWLEQLHGPLALDDCAVVCGRVSFPHGDGRSYLLPDLHDESGRYFYAFITWCSRHMNGLHNMQQVTYCGWEMTMMKKRVFVDAGGLNYHQYPEVMAMADFALKLAAGGQTIQYTPYARMIRAGSDLESELSVSTSTDREKVLFQRAWCQVLLQGDPFYNRGILEDHDLDPLAFRAWLTGLPEERIA